MSIAVNGTNGLTFNDGSAQNTAATGFGFKNRIINGAMMIDQRNAGASVSTTATTAYTVDRFAYFATQASKFTVQQNAGSVTPPLGFVNYLGVTSSSAYSVISSDNFGLKQVVEGNNIADFNWGTANAQPVTLSFWVRSSITGTFGGSLLSIAANRSYPFTYTISASNTWQQITVSVPAITSGSWNTNNNEGVQVVFGLGVGSTLSGTAGSWATGIYTSATGATSVVGTNGATFYITGVQLEKGSTATSFDYRPYGTELALCQRYYWRMTTNGQNYSNFGLGYATSATNAYVQIKNPVTMRAIPSGIDVSAAGTIGTQFNASPTIGPNALGVDYTVVQITGSGMSANQAVALFAQNSASGYIGASAEL
jgi:hypothetical protein